MIDTNRKTVTTHKYIHFIDFFQSSVEETAVYIRKLSEEGWTGIDYAECEVALIRTRLETDEEYEERIAMETNFEQRAETQKEWARKSRYEQYLKLKEEFGND